jgi:hypothetical protein
MKKGMRIVVALAATATLGLAVPATAGQAVKSKLTLKQVTANGAKGTLSSKESKCEKRRKIELQWQGEYTPVRVAKTKTDAKGRWKIDKSITRRGYFYAVALGVERGKTTCARAESKSLRFN